MIMYLLRHKPRYIKWRLGLHMSDEGLRTLCVPVAIELTRPPGLLAVCSFVPCARISLPDV